MRKREIIDSIMQLNRSARVEFLADFSERELLEYLHHLRSVLDPPLVEQVPQHALVA